MNSFSYARARATCSNVRFRGLSGLRLTRRAESGFVGAGGRARSGIALTGPPGSPGHLNAVGQCILG
jgi:hypothetical protein